MSQNLVIQTGAFELARVPLSQSPITIGLGDDYSVNLRLQGLGDVHFLVEWSDKDDREGCWSLTTVGGSKSLSSLLEVGYVIKASGLQFSIEQDPLGSEIESRSFIWQQLKNDLKQTVPQEMRTGAALEIIHLQGEVHLARQLNHYSYSPVKYFRSQLLPLLKLHFQNPQEVHVAGFKALNAHISLRAPGERFSDFDPAQTAVLKLGSYLKIKQQNEIYILRLVKDLTLPLEAPRSPAPVLFTAVLALLFIVGGGFWFKPSNSTTAPRLSVPKSPPRIARLQLPPPPSPVVNPLPDVLRPTPQVVQRVTSPPVKPTPLKIEPMSTVKRTPAPVSPAVTAKNAAPARSAGARRGSSGGGTGTSRGKGFGDPSGSGSGGGVLALINRSSDLGPPSTVSANQILESTAPSTAPTAGPVLQILPRGTRSDKPTSRALSSANLAKASTQVRPGSAFQGERDLPAMESLKADPSALRNHGFGRGGGNGLGGGNGSGGGSGGGGSGSVNGTMTITGGGLTESEVMNGLATSRSKIKECYEIALSDSPTLNGALTLQWIIAPKGQVTSVTPLKRQFNHPRLSNCVLGIIKGTTFVKSTTGSGTVVEYTFDFRRETRARN